MRQLADNQPTAEGFLSVLGAGNWGGPSKTSAVMAGAKEGDEGGLLQRYLSEFGSLHARSRRCLLLRPSCPLRVKRRATDAPDLTTDDVLSVLLTALDTRAKLLRGRQGTSPIFLLNNLSYIRHSVLSSSIIDVLGESSEDTLNKRMRTAKASYLDIWSPLVSALLDAGFAEQSGAAGALKAGLGAVTGGGGTERRETKDRFVRFGEALDEVAALHAQARIDEGEVELRERLKGEVERMVVPTYAKFVQRHRKDNCASVLRRLLRSLSLRQASQGFRA